MASDFYIISIDQGTSSCRVVLLNDKGIQVGMAQQEFTQIFPNPGWVEHDPLEIWKVQMKVLDNLVDTHNIDPSRIKAIGITNQRETTVVWDKQSGKPVYNAIVWQDKRTIAYCKELKEEGLQTYTTANMGLPIDPYFSGTKLKWILDQGVQGDLAFGTMDTWLIWNMTKGEKHVTDYTNASRTLLYNIKKKKWDDQILTKMGIPKELLPSVQDSASHFGDFTYRGVKIPITGVAGDQQAALFGQACFEKGMVKNTYGTGCFMLMNIGDKFKESKQGLLTTLCCDKNGKVAYALEGSIFMAGASIQWLRDSLQIITDSKDSEKLALEVKDSNEVVVVPAFAGLGAPYWTMECKGAVFGLSRDTTKAHLSKAMLDSIALRTKEVIDAMEKDSEIQLSILKVDGGASKNNYLMQFQSDMLDSEVSRPSNVETTALGAGFLAGIGCGVWTASLLEKNIQEEKRYSSSMNEEKRVRIYAQWQKAVQQAIGFSE